MVPFFLAAEVAEDCWWTGCQPTTWAVRGCENYGRKAEGREVCKGGHKFKCCADPTLSTTENPIPDPSCWWTGCQKYDWAKQGCRQYQKIEMEQRTCENGAMYLCCDPSDGGDNLPKKECWWSSCLVANTSTFVCPKNLERGGSQDCGEGETMFECCGDSPIVKE